MAKTNGCHDYGLKNSEVKVVYEKVNISMLSIPSLLNVAGKRISNWFDHDDQCIKLHQTFFYNGFEIERFGRHHSASKLCSCGDADEEVQMCCC